MAGRGSPSDDEMFGFFMARRFAKPWRAKERGRPKMPSGIWRLAAIVVTVVGALLGTALAMAVDWVPLRRAVIGAFGGFVVGMYAVETWWERRAASDHGNGPIGPRT